uniref:Deleted in azoospermia-associated protein 2 n=1 Tax=Caenorhabditis japonica TaxID=281687 RepID=A0A8R1HR12_CAEJA
MQLPIRLLVLPLICLSQYYNPSLYQSYLNAGVPRQQTVFVPVFTQGAIGGGYPGYGNYGMGYPGYGGGYPGGYPMMGTGGSCCGGGGVGAEVGMMPHRESNAKKFLRGATEGVVMGSIGMLGFRR